MNNVLLAILHVYIQVYYVHLHGFYTQNKLIHVRILLIRRDYYYIEYIIHGSNNQNYSKLKLTLERVS